MSQIVTERTIITELLKEYKNSRCLWDPLNIHYFVKEPKKAAYDKLLKIWQRMHPNDTVDDVKRKIEHCRAAYRRQRKKVEHNVMSAASPKVVYKPNLWYYSLLSFLNANTNIDQSSPEKEKEDIPPKKKTRFSKNIDTIENIANEKRQYVTAEETQQGKLYELSYETTYALTIAKQLKELDAHVRYEAERIISEVIYRARTGTLPKYNPLAIESLVVSQSEPSWYDDPNVDNDQQQIQFKVLNPCDSIKTECEEEEEKQED